MPETITLPLPPNRANARGHWAQIHKERTQYQRKCLPLIYKTFGPIKPSPKYRHVRISMHFYVWSLNDWDNLIARAKWAWDELVKTNIIADDSPKYVDLGDVKQTVDRKHQRLDLTLEATDDRNG